MTTPCTEVERLKGIEADVKEINKKLSDQAILDAEHAKDIQYIIESLKSVDLPAMLQESGKNNVARKMSWFNLTGLVGLAMYALKDYFLKP